MLLPVLFIFLGFVLLIVGADLLVDGSSNIAKKFHIPEIIIGLTVVSIGTSMPELFVSITSALENHADMAIGNVLGSNLCNMLLILGLSAMIRPVKFQRETRIIEIPMCLIITFILLIMCNINSDISKLESIILLVLFVFFILYTIYMGKKGEEFDSKDSAESASKKEQKLQPIAKSIVFVILGIIGLKFGGDLTVNNAVVIAEHFNLSEKIISLTILAIGTSLPELFTSVTAAYKGNSDIAIGNILGSNIFNMLLIIGCSAFIRPITYNMSYNFDFIYLVVATIILALFPIIPPKNKMCRFNGTIYFLMYVAYMVALFNLK